jgi:flagellar FliJ protein
MDRRFRLQSVLNYRQDVEEALQLELSVLVAEEQSARDRLQALRDDAARAMEGIVGFQTQARADVAIIEQGFVYLDVMARAVADQDAVVADAAARADAKRQQLVEAMQARKAMEKLKERHDRAFAAWADRVEQTRIDDMVTVRYNRRAAEGEQVAV